MVYATKTKNNPKLIVQEFTKMRTRISLVNCLLIFIIGWIGGLLLIQYIFETPTGQSFRHSFTSYDLPNSDVSKFISSMGKVLSDYSLVESTKTTPPQRKSRYLPSYQPYNISLNRTQTTEQIHILLGWTVDDRLFTIDNYKALESLLNVYPTATFRCLLPTSRDAYVHKIGNTLSINQFLKYKKKGYDINIMPLNIKQKSQTSAYGEKYQEKWYKICCTTCSTGTGSKKNTTTTTTSTTCNREYNQHSIHHQQQQPYHLHTYIRLTKLYQHGGIFSDFSFLFLGPLHNIPTMQQGYLIYNWCGNQYHEENWQIEENKNREKSLHTSSSSSSDSSATRTKQYDCVTSTLLLFKKPRSEVLLCILKYYDDEEFIHCIESDGVYYGAVCIKHAFDKCFHTHKLTNDLIQTINTAEGSDSKEIQDQDIGNSIEIFHENAFHASNTLLSNDWDVKQGVRALWLGSLSYTGSWKHYPYQNNTLIGTVVSRIRLKNDYFSGTSSSHSCLLTSLHKNACSHYATNLSTIQSSASSSPSVSLLLRRGSVFARKKTTTYQTGMEEAACAPSVFIAGFRNSASRFLFDALVRHPHILPALSGAYHKDTHCYSTSRSTTSTSSSGSSSSERLLGRSWCFPFIEALEPFVSVDGSVAYSADSQSALSISQDNPKAKILFIVRNPTERLYSSYKYHYLAKFASLGTFDEFFLPTLLYRSKLSELREMITNKTEISDIIDYYYNHTSSVHDLKERTELWFHSIYIIPILYYQTIFGRENVLIVSAEDIDVQNPVRMVDTLNAVFSFIGVCPMPIADLVPSLPSPNLVPPSQQMSRDMFHALTLFFQPFNDLLALHSGINTTLWNTKTPPSKLPKYSRINKTLSQLWFIKKEIIKTSHLLPQLLPQRTAEEKSGYNTTLGMLNTF